MEVEIISKEYVKPSSPTPHNLKIFELSILDQLVITPYVTIILYYPNNHGDTIFQAIERSVALKKSLSKTLTRFYPLAGAIKNHLSIDCDDVGANFGLALVHRCLDDFLRNPDHGLINRFLPFAPFVGSSVGARVTNVQMNIFECGGIVIGMCISHRILDGAALHTFLKGWSNMARGAKEVVYPNLTAPSLFPAKSSWLRDTSKEKVLKQGKCVTKRFLFGSDALAKLKTEAATNGVPNPTRVEVVSSLIWKCAMAASKEACGSQNSTSLLFHLVNLRKKLGPSLSKDDFICNMIWMANVVCNPDSDDETTLHGLANKVQESISKIDAEFVNKAQGDEGYIVLMKSLEEIGQIVPKGGPVDNYCFSSWCNMGFYETDFGWGKPSWVTNCICDGIPVFMNLVILMDTKCHDGGIEAWVSLDEKDMEILKGNQELCAYASIDPSPL